MPAPPPPQSAFHAALTGDALLAQVFEDAPIGMTVVDPANCFRRVNRRMCEITGYRPQDLIGYDAATITHPPDRPRVAALIDEMISSGRRTGQIEKRYVHAGGDLIPAVLSVSVVLDDQGRPAYFIGQVEDITDRKAHESQAAQQARELERSNSELQQFAYAASHDLQEPLRVLTVCVEMLRREYGSELDDEAQELIAFAIGASQQMTALIDDLLDLARAGSDSAPTETVDLDSALDAALAQLHVLVEAEHAEIIRDNPLGEVQGRAAHLTRLLQNLVGNAL